MKPGEIDVGVNLRSRGGDELERRFGVFGGIERRGVGTADRFAELDGVEWRTDGQGRMTLRGHAAVFNRLSLDLGGFKERIATGFFDSVLDRDPHVVLDQNHDFNYILGSTRALDQNNGGLELALDDTGLRFFSLVVRDPDSGETTSYANDLRILMAAGLVRQASFMFTVERDEWLIDDQGNVTRTLLECGDLYDVCVCAMGAYPQTDSQLLRNRALAYAVEQGRLPDEARAFLSDVAGPSGLGGGENPTSRDSAGAEDTSSLIDVDLFDRRARLARVRSHRHSTERTGS